MLDVERWKLDVSPSLSLSPFAIPPSSQSNVTASLRFPRSSHRTGRGQPDETIAVHVTINKARGEKIMIMFCSTWQARHSFSKQQAVRPGRFRRGLVFLVAALLLFFGSWRMARAADGDLDPTFGIGGKVVTDFTNGTDWLSRIAVQPDGKIVAIGDTFPSRRGALARYNPDGTLDVTFGNGGKVITVAS